MQTKNTLYANSLGIPLLGGSNFNLGNKEVEQCYQVWVKKLDWACELAIMIVMDGCVYNPVAVLCSLWFHGILFVLYILNTH